MGGKSRKTSRVSPRLIRRLLGSSREGKKGKRGKGSVSGIARRGGGLGVLGRVEEERP